MKLSTIIAAMLCITLAACKTTKQTTTQASNHVSLSELSTGISLQHTHYHGIDILDFFDFRDSAGQDTAKPQWRVVRRTDIHTESNARDTSKNVVESHYESEQVSNSKKRTEGSVPFTFQCVFVLLSCAIIIHVLMKAG